MMFTHLIYIVLHGTPLMLLCSLRKFDKLLCLQGNSSAPVYAQLIVKEQAHGLAQVDKLAEVAASFGAKGLVWVALRKTARWWSNHKVLLARRV